MNGCYFWDGNQVIQVDYQVAETGAKPYLAMFCVDMRQDTDYSRYGKFLKGMPGMRLDKWKHVPYAEFPKEFKAHLLLLL